MFYEGHTWKLNSLKNDFQGIFFFISSFHYLMYLFISSEFCLVFLLLWQQIHPSKFNTKFKISSQLALPLECNWTTATEEPFGAFGPPFKVRKLIWITNIFWKLIFIFAISNKRGKSVRSSRNFNFFCSFFGPQNTSLPRYNLRFRPLSQVQLVSRRSCW